MKLFAATETVFFSHIDRVQNFILNNKKWVAVINFVRKFWALKRKITVSGSSMIFTSVIAWPPSLTTHRHHPPHPSSFRHFSENFSLKKRPKPICHSFVGIGPLTYRDNWDIYITYCSILKKINMSKYFRSFFNCQISHWRKDVLCIYS